jgi:hypothetical protein
MSSNEKVTHPRTRRPALSTEPLQAALGHADARLTNQPTPQMTGVNEHGRHYPEPVLDSAGRPIRPGV